MEKGTCSMYVLWDGAWETVSGNFAFCQAKTKHVKFKRILTFTELLEKAYDITQVNLEEFDIEMTMWAKHQSRSLVVPVNDDDDVEQLFQFNTENRCSVPLCLVLKRKEIGIFVPPPPNAQEKESHNSNTHVGGKGLTFEAESGSAAPLLGSAGAWSAELAGVGSAVGENGLIHASVSETCSNDVDEPMVESHDDAVQRTNEIVQALPPDNIIFGPINESTESAKLYIIQRVNENECGSSALNTRKRKVSTLSNKTCSSLCLDNDVKVNQIFNTKADLVRQLKLSSILKNKEIKSKNSDPRRFIAVCCDENCPWRMCATTMCGSFWVVERYHDIHTCSVDLMNHKKRNAIDSFVAEIIKDKYSNQTHVFPPAAIMSEVKKSLFINIDYKTAWRAREKAISLVMGTPTESFAKLPAYFHRLKEVNPGTITHIERHDDGHFKYCFMSLGASIRGFKRNIRPVVAINNTFLRGKYGGILLSATGMDDNNQVFPIAFGIVDLENNESWNWFLVKLHEIIGELEGLAIISDRNASILKGVDEVFPDAYHGICTFHLKCKVVAKFENVDVTALLFRAAKTYDVVEHRSCMNAILAVDNRVYHYLTKDVTVDQWARVYFPGHRYSIMTTNIAESMNDLVKDIRDYPPVVLLDTIVTKLLTWYAERREVSLNMRGPLTTWAERKITNND